MAVVQTVKTLLAIGFAAVLALAFVLASPAAAQLEDLQEQCPEEFPLCPEGEEGGEDDGLGEGEGEDDGFEDDGFGEGEDDGFEDDPQVSETPEGGVAAGTGAMGDGGPLPVLLAGALGLAALGGLAVRRRFAPQA